MNETSNFVPLRHPDEIDDPLTNILRSGARRLLAQAIESEAEAFLAAMKDLKLTDGRDRLVRHGHGPHGRSRRESGLSRSNGLRFGIAKRPATTNGFASRRRSC